MRPAKKRVSRAGAERKAERKSEAGRVSRSGASSGRWFHSKLSEAVLLQQRPHAAPQVFENGTEAGQEVDAGTGLKTATLLTGKPQSYGGVARHVKREREQRQKNVLSVHLERARSPRRAGD